MKLLLVNLFDPIEFVTLRYSFTEWSIDLSETKMAAPCYSGAVSKAPQKAKPKR